MTQTVSSGTRVTPADLAAFLHRGDARIRPQRGRRPADRRGPRHDRHAGTFTHGTRQLRGLLKNVRTGRLSATAHEEIVAEGPAGPSWMRTTPCRRRCPRPLDGAGDGKGADMRHRLRRRPAQQPLRRRRLLRQSGRGARHVRHVHVQRGPVHDRAGLEGQGARHQPHRLRRARRRGEAGLPGYRHQRGRRDQNLLGQGAGQADPRQLAGGRRRHAHHRSQPVPAEGRAVADGRAQRVRACRDGRNPDRGAHRRSGHERGEQLGAGLAEPDERRARVRSPSTSLR